MGDAKVLVVKAKEVLETFYIDSGLMSPALAQLNPGEAPVPAPTTWVDPYAGNTGEASGIIAILNMVIQDIDKDNAKAEAAEVKANDEFGTLKTDLESFISSTVELISGFQGEKSVKEQGVTDATGDRSLKHEDLQLVLKRMEGAAPDCDYFALNYPVRTKNRQIEIDGLQKAKAILQGGAFDGLPDPNREIKPGDALFLQPRPHM